MTTHLPLGVNPPLAVSDLWPFRLPQVTELLDVSMELGCFLAGALISSQGHMVTEEVVAYIEPIRDFLVIIFFASIGNRPCHTGTVPWWLRLPRPTHVFLSVRPEQLQGSWGLQRDLIRKGAFALGNVNLLINGRAPGVLRCPRGGRPPPSTPWARHRCPAG